MALVTMFRNRQGLPDACRPQDETTIRNSSASDQNCCSPSRNNPDMVERGALRRLNHEIERSVGWRCSGC